MKEQFNFQGENGEDGVGFGGWVLGGVEEGDRYVVIRFLLVWVFFIQNFQLNLRVGRDYV